MLEFEFGISLDFMLHFRIVIGCCFVCRLFVWLGLLRWVFIGFGFGGCWIMTCLSWWLWVFIVWVLITNLGFGFR